MSVSKSLEPRDCAPPVDITASPDMSEAELSSNDRLIAMSPKK